MPYQVNAPARSDPAKDYGDLDGLVREGDRRRALPHRAASLTASETIVGFGELRQVY